MSILLIIPAYEPDEVLVSIVAETLRAGKETGLQISTLIVNDGSSAQSQKIFDELSTWEGVVVLHSVSNQGKGAALKKGIRHALAKTDGQAEMVVTADADGQHLPKDIIAVAAVAMEKQSTAIGVRNFDSSVPLRSRFGNLLTRQVFRLVSGHDIRDTQTGLRAIMRHDLYALVDIPYNRYEFELEMLSTLVKAGPVEQVPINTVYEPQNPTSHFNPVIDSIRIYWVLFRYFFTILLISASEAFFIFLLTKLGASILVTIVVARAISVILYFNIARTFVFRSNGDVWKQAVQLLLLVAVNLVFLYAFVSILEIGFDTPRVLAAILGNMAFFVINFIVQRNLIFAVATRADKKEESN